MHNIDVDATYCYACCSMVCLCVRKGMNRAKAAEPIEMPFGMWAWVGPADHVLDGGPRFPGERAIWGYMGMCVVHILN